MLTRWLLSYVYVLVGFLAGCVPIPWLHLKRCQDKPSIVHGTVGLLMLTGDKAGRMSPFLSMNKS